MSSDSQICPVYGIGKAQVRILQEDNIALPHTLQTVQAQGGNVGPHDQQRSLVARQPQASTHTE